MRSQTSSLGNRQRSIRWRKVGRTAVFYVLLVVILVPFMLPFVWMLLNSLKYERDLLAIPPIFIFTPTLRNFQKILSMPRWPRYLMNSVIIAVASTALALLLGLPSAFAIARYKMRRISSTILVIRILPHVGVLVPWYIMFVLLGLNNTHGALIFTHMVLALPLTIWIMVPFFQDMPHELLDAAFIDGCSLRQAFLRVALPVCLPGIVTAVIFSFTASWNNFILSWIIGGSDTMTLPVVAYNQMAWDRIYYGPMAAAGMVVVTPILLLTLVMQRYLQTGLTLGATGG